MQSLNALYDKEITEMTRWEKMAALREKICANHISFQIMAQAK